MSQTVNQTTDRYAVFGNPISHSKSPLLQMAFAEQTQQNITYTAECVDTNAFTTAAESFFSAGGKGLNITVPFKIDAFHYAKKLTERAKRAGAVNTLFQDHSGEIVGDNTDGIGLVNDIKNNLAWTIKDKKVLILGAGGAVRGILEPFINEQPKSITIANRTVSKASSLAADFSDIYGIEVSSFTDLNDHYDVIINGTSASLAGDLPPLPSTILTKDSCCYDMMYSKDPTPFLVWCQQQGCNQLSDGLGMLVCQGAESFFIWRQRKPEVAPVIKQIRNIL
ncbi:MAG: shikimate dehydrogenase [Cellvibrionaceae bacterium]